MYDRLLTSGRPVPKVREGVDSTHVIVERRVLHPGVIRLMTAADRRYQLSQRERIVLGLLGQTEGMYAGELASYLELEDTASLRPWLSGLLDAGLVEQTGRTKATRYFVPPALVKDAGLDEKTTLARIEAPRLRALLLEDVSRYEPTSAPDIHRRVGSEIPERTFRRILRELVEEEALIAEGEKRWRRYRLGQTPPKNGDSGR